MNFKVDVENSTDDSTEYANVNSSFSNISDSQISPLHNENYWYNCLPTKLITTASIPNSQEPKEAEPPTTAEDPKPSVVPEQPAMIKLRTPQKLPKVKLDKKEKINSIRYEFNKKLENAGMLEELALTEEMEAKIKEIEAIPDEACIDLEEESSPERNEEIEEVPRPSAPMMVLSPLVEPEMEVDEDIFEREANIDE